MGRLVKYKSSEVKFIDFRTHLKIGMCRKSKKIVFNGIESNKKAISDFPRPTSIY